MHFTLTALQLLVTLHVTIAAPANYDGESTLNACELSSFGHQEYSWDLGTLSVRDFSTIGACADNIFPDLVGCSSKRWSCSPTDEKEKERAKKEPENSKKELRKARADLKKAQSELKANKVPKRKKYFEQKVYDGTEVVNREQGNIKYWQSCIS